MSITGSEADFEDKGQNFLQWLRSEDAIISPKFALVDYRDRHEGRAVGTFS